MISGRSHGPIVHGCKRCGRIYSVWALAGSCGRSTCMTCPRSAPPCALWHNVILVSILALPESDVARDVSKILTLVSLPSHFQPLWCISCPQDEATRCWKVCKLPLAVHIDRSLAQALRSRAALVAALRSRMFQFWLKFW